MTLIPGDDLNISFCLPSDPVFTNMSFCIAGVKSFEYEYCLNPNYVLSKNMKISCHFSAVKRVCILHRRVFVMDQNSI